MSIFLAADATFWNSWLGECVGLLSIPALVVLNAFFVAAEFAVASVRRTRVEELVGQKVPGAKAVARALAQIDRTIAATQLGITLTSLGLGAGVATVLAQDLQQVMPWLAAYSLSGVVAFLLITYLHVVFGELIPKSLALQAPDRVALWTAGPLGAFARIARPLILIMNVSARLTLRLCGLKTPVGVDMVHSVQELSLVIEDTEEAGLLDAEQAELVQNVFRLSNKHVKDCMIPREKMAALELHTSPEKVLEAVRAGAHTRMPIYDKDIDNIVGIVNTKNLFFLFSLRGVVVLEDALYPALFLKPDEELGNALRVFRKARRPMALVRNEAGTILGAITLEDILEEIVGDIEDEHDYPAVPRLTRRS